MTIDVRDERKEDARQRIYRLVDLLIDGEVPAFYARVERNAVFVETYTEVKRETVRVK